ncbi:MAG: PIN domain-containing protein, partial [Halobacteriaceae archaeon]
MQVVPDTSVVVDGRVSARVADGPFAGATVVVPEAVVAELEAQANDGRETGWDGLAELRALADLADDGDIELRYVGDRPDEGQIRGAAAGDIDALIRAVAADHDAVLYTSDPVQREAAAAKGIDVEYVEPRTDDGGDLDIEAFFDDETMSVHLAAGVRPMAKRGDIGEMRYEPVGEEPLSAAEL